MNNSSLQKAVEKKYGEKIKNQALNFSKNCNFPESPLSTPLLNLGSIPIKITLQSCML